MVRADDLSNWITCVPSNGKFDSIIDWLLKLDFCNFDNLSAEGQISDDNSKLFVFITERILLINNMGFCRQWDKSNYQVFLHSGHVELPLDSNHLYRHKLWNIFVQVLHFFLGSW